MVMSPSRSPLIVHRLGHGPLETAHHRGALGALRERLSPLALVLGACAEPTLGGRQRAAQRVLVLAVAVGQDDVAHPTSGRRVAPLVALRQRQYDLGHEPSSMSSMQVLTISAVNAKVEMVMPHRMSSTYVITRTLCRAICFGIGSASRVSLRVGNSVILATPR